MKEIGGTRSLLAGESTRQDITLTDRAEILTSLGVK